MEYIREVNINEATIHLLLNGSEEPILSNNNMNLSEETYKFLLKHIERLLKDENLKYARFEEDSKINKLSQMYLSCNNSLLDISAKMAIDMFNLMKSNNIPSCALIVVSVCTEFGNMIGVLKCDFSKSYTYEINTIENDKMIIDIKTDEIIPLSTSKIEKCAFIKEKKDNNIFDLMIMDKRKKNKKEEYGENWFNNKYLQCNFIENERDLTKKFINLSEHWTRTNLNENADDAEMVRRKIKEELKENENINIPQLAERIFKENEGAKLSFIKCVTEDLEREVVPIDKRYLDKKLKRIKLKIDKDIEVYINDEAYKDSSRFEVKRNGDGTINIVIKNVINYVEK